MASGWRTRVGCVGLDCSFPILADRASPVKDESFGGYFQKVNFFSVTPLEIVSF